MLVLLQITGSYIGLNNVPEIIQGECYIALSFLVAQYKICTSS
jgi:hypothetical protein